MLGKMEIRTPPGSRPRDGRHCDLCGCSQPAVRCDKCGCQIFCLSCDDMYHRHPKRRFHLRKAVDPTPPVPQARPVLPVKVAHLNTSSPGDPSKMPLPPPRKKKSLFGSFRKPSPSSDNSPPLPKKEYSWTDRLGSIKKFMSNRPLPPLPNDESDAELQATTNGQPTRGDLSFIHRKSEERPPQLPQRSPRSPDFPGMNQEKENRVPSTAPHMPGQMRNGSIEPTANHQNREFPTNEENHWNNMPNNHNGPQNFGTMNRQNQQRGFAPPGMPGYPGGMHQSSSATDLHNMPNADGMPGAAQMHQHFPHYPMNPHMPPHYPYPMYPQYPGNYPQYFGNSFANLSNVPTSEGDFSDDHSETASSRHSSRKQAFRKRAKRSQSVMMDRMGYPGQFYPFGPYPGYGPWGAPMPMDAPPSPASSVRSLNRSGRARRRKKLTSEEDDEEFSVSSSPLSRPKSSSSDPKDPPRAPLATQTTSSEDESEGEPDNRRMKLSTIQRRQSDPLKTGSPTVESKRVAKLKKSSSKQSDSDAQDSPEIQAERRPSKDSSAEQSSQQPQLLQASAPSDTWECKHCTFVNPAGNRICQVCCKTATPRTETPVTTQSRPPSAAPGSRKQSVDSERGYVTPDQPQEMEEEVSTRDKQDMASLNSALDEAEKQISRGLEELMKLKDDIDSNYTKEKNRTAESPSKKDAGESSKPVYKSSGRMRTSILDKLNLNKPQTSNASVSTSTDTQTGQSNWTSDRIIEARRPSNSSTTSDTYNSPMAQSPELGSGFLSSNQKRDSSCQTQQDSLVEYLEKKKAAEEAFLGRPVNNFGFSYGDRMDMMTSPVPSMYDRFLGGGYGMMQRSHSRASLFTGRMNDLGPMDYGGGFGYPMYRSVSRGSLSGDYPDGRMSEFNLRKPDFYLSMEELVERRRQENIRAQGLELVRMIREAEQQGFNADDIQVALTHCGKQNPLEWLQENWRNMVDSVITLSTNYGNDKKENDIGLLSENEAREALRLHKGNIWAAVTECVEGRQRKYLELSARGSFSRKDIVDSLTSSEGEVEMAYAKLTKGTGKPFLMRIWGAGEGVQNQDGARPLSDDMNDLPQRYLKEGTSVNSDELSEEIWSEDGDWDDDDDDYEKGDMEELQTCREDLYTGPQEMRTPESDKSDYGDPFPADDRNASSPSDDIFFVIPDAKPEKKKGFLSKLVALRKNSREKADDMSNIAKDEVPLEENIQSKDDSISQNSASSSEQQKNNGALNALKNTLSAIKDTVTGGAKNDKKLPCAQPEKRTIIVRGQIDHESLSSDSKDTVQLTSIKPIESDSLLALVPEKESSDMTKKSVVQNVSAETKEQINDGVKNESDGFGYTKAEQLKDDQKNKDMAESQKINISKTVEPEMILETKKPLSLTERLKFAKQTRTATTPSGISTTSNENNSATVTAREEPESKDTEKKIDLKLEIRTSKNVVDEKGGDKMDSGSISKISSGDPYLSTGKEKKSDSSHVIPRNKSPVRQNANEEIKIDQEHISTALVKSDEGSATAAAQNTTKEPILQNKPGTSKDEALPEKYQRPDKVNFSNEEEVVSSLPENQPMQVITTEDNKNKGIENTLVETDSAHVQKTIAVHESDSSANSQKDFNKSKSILQEITKTDAVTVPDTKENVTNSFAEHIDPKTKPSTDPEKLEKLVKTEECVPSTSSASVNKTERDINKSVDTVKTEKQISAISSTSNNFITDIERKDLSTDNSVKREVSTISDTVIRKPLNEETNEKEVRENKIISDIPKTQMIVTTTAASTSVSETAVNEISNKKMEKSGNNSLEENQISQKEVAQVTENQVHIDSKNFPESTNHSKIESVAGTSVSNKGNIIPSSEEKPQNETEEQKISIVTSNVVSIVKNNEVTQETPNTSSDLIPENKSLNHLQKTENNVSNEVPSKNVDTHEINLTEQSLNQIIPECKTVESSTDNLTTQQESKSISAELKTTPEKSLDSVPSQINLEQSIPYSVEDKNANINAPSSSQSTVQDEVAESKDSEKSLQNVENDSEKSQNNIIDNKDKTTTVPFENKNDSPSASEQEDSKTGKFKFSKSGKVKKTQSKFDKNDSVSQVKNKNQTTNVTPSTSSTFQNKTSINATESSSKDKIDVTPKNNGLSLFPTSKEQTKSKPLNENLSEMSSESSPDTVGNMEAKITSNDSKVSTVEEAKTATSSTDNKSPGLDTASGILTEGPKNNALPKDLTTIPEESSSSSSAVKDEVKTNKIQELPKVTSLEQKTLDPTATNSNAIKNKEKEPPQEVKLQEPVVSKEFPGNKNNLENNVPSSANSNVTSSNISDVSSSTSTALKDAKDASSSETPEEIEQLAESQNITNTQTSTPESSTPGSSELPNKSVTVERTVSEDNSPAADSDDTDIQYSDDSRPSSVTPPNPIDALRSRFEGLAGVPSVRGQTRPQSPFRRMSFNSRKQVIALERIRDANEKPWFHQKIVTEPVRTTLPKRTIKQQLEIERRVRQLVSDRKCRTYRKAEVVVQLMDMNFEEDEAIQAANECSTLEQALSYLQQECQLCAGHFPVSQIVSMTHCQHRACRECIRAYFTVQIRDRTILDLLCPFCNEPDIGDEDVAQDYFNHLDIMLKKLVDVEIHELFQRKLRDRVLMKDPNFRWCSQCSSGFIAMPNLKRLVCPDCNAVTCASCRRLWEREHQGISCEAFAALKDSTDLEAQAADLAKMLTEDGIDCPRCHFKYALAKGGCMHFRCIQCQHDFCSGCSRPFRMGQKCGVSEFCAKLGLHAHHPRNCLFYLRDKEPEDLQKLLDMNDIKYNTEPPETTETENTCEVMEQKETADGMIDDYCGKEVQEGYAGLCRIHYVEYLGQLVNKNKVDPIQIFENDDLELVLRRANIRLPPRRYRENDIQYREKLVNLIQEELPLDKMDGS